MKAQSLRRVLTFADVGLVLALGGVGAWYVLEARPAAASSGAKPWEDAAFKAWQQDAQNVRPTTLWQVDEKDFDHIRRPDLMDRTKGGPGVFPFVGPIPPPPVKPEENKPPPVEAPKGIAAIARLVAVFYGRGTHSTITLEFLKDKKLRSYSEGHVDPISDGPVEKAPEVVADATQPPPRRPGKYLVSVEPAPEAEGVARYRLVYDEIAADGKLARKEEVLPLAIPASAISTKPSPIVALGPGGQPVAGPKPGPGGPEPAPAAGGSLTDVRIARIDRGSGRVDLHFDEHWDRLAKADLSELVNDVRTEDVKDARGGGVKIMGLAGIGEQFGVQQGDIIRKINGTPVHSRADAIEVAKGMPKDTAEVVVELERDGAVRTIAVDPRDPKVRAAAGKARFQK